MTTCYFVTGTDTGIGKTLIANALLIGAAERGLSTLGLKPVSAGCEHRDGQWMNDDAYELMRNSSTNLAYPDVNPVALREAMAPHIAAARENRMMDAAALAAHCRTQAARADFCVIEGAGGWLVPVNAEATMADLAGATGAAVILVVGMRLGCLNHALLTAQAIETAGLNLAGWVANHVDPEMVVAEENVTSLAGRIKAPLLGTVPFATEPNSAQVASKLNLEALCT